MDTRKQIAERLGTANNVLVTVSANPTVDQLAACIGLTLALNKLGKHSTAVFSGQVPDTIDFLKPDKTIEKTADSLRDFIIALDKSKADKLRYKVEDKVVKIFITPYQTSLSEDDLAFSQGDFNVDVVMALGVAEQRDLDQAITAHGRILHDATVVSLNTSGSSELGSLNWVDGGASCLSEMVAALLRDLDKKSLDNQIATALLTGIVAATDRFRNEQTTARSLSISSDLMSAGANQQLITSQLDHQLDVRQSGGTSSKSNYQESDGSTGTLSVDHDSDETGEPADEGSSDSSDKTEPPLPPEAPEVPELPAPEPPELPKVHRVRSLPDQGIEPDSFDSNDTTPDESNDKPIIDSNQLTDQLGGQPRSQHKQKLLSHDKPLATDLPEPNAMDASEPSLPEQPTPVSEPPTPLGKPAPASPPTEPEDPAKIPDMWSSTEQPSAGPLPPPDLPASPVPATPAPMPPSPPVPEPPRPTPPPSPAPPTPAPTPPPQVAPEPKPPAPVPKPVAPTPEPAKQPESQSEAKPKDSAVDVEAARAEVMRALSEAPDDDRPEPLQAINAQPLGDNLHAAPPAGDSSLPTPPAPAPQPSQTLGQPLSPSPVGPPPTPAATPMDMPMPGAAAPAQAPPQPQNLPYSTPKPFGPPSAQPPASPGNLPPAAPTNSSFGPPPPPVPPPMVPPPQR